MAKYRFTMRGTMDGVVWSVQGVLWADHFREAIDDAMRQGHQRLSHETDVIFTLLTVAEITEDER